ncbi:MAG: translocation/assembly module TamB domain-containing protein [Flavobacteriales bacterium]|nr:translocation/assembly module TamB domain-containing protein [Flavobacteriales bacterium]
MIKKTLTKIVKICFLSFILAFPVFVWLICIPIGQERLLIISKNWVNRHTAYSIDYSGLQGNLWYAFDFASLEVRRQGEMMFSAKNLKINWEPLALIRKNLHILEVSAAVIKINQSKRINQTQFDNSNIFNTDISSLRLPIRIDRIYLPIDFQNTQLLFEGNLDLLQQNITINVQHKENKLAYFESKRRDGLVKVIFEVFELDKILKNVDYNLENTHIIFKFDVSGALKNFIFQGNIEGYSKVKYLSKIDVDMNILAKVTSSQSGLSSDVSIFFDNTPIFEAKIRYIWVDQFLDAEINVKNMSLNYLLRDDDYIQKQIGNSAKLNVDTRVKGFLKQPEINGDLTINNLQIIANDSPKIIELKSTFSTKENHYLVDLFLMHQNQKISDAKIKFLKNIAPFFNRKDLDIESQFNINIQKFYDFFRKPALDVGGIAVGDLKIKGDLQSPKVTGDIHVTDGEIKHKFYGLDLHNIDCHAVAALNHIELKNCKGFDNEEGQLDVQGGFILKAPYDINSRLIIENLKILNNDEYSGYVSGKLNLDGAILAPNIVGDLTFDRVSIKLSEISAPLNQKLNIIAKEKFDAQKKIQDDSVQKGMADIQLKFPQRVFIRGKGLDAELSGNLRVFGSMGDPILNGSLSVKRGTYQFLNKKFKIKKGTVTIFSEDILLDFVANTSANGIFIDVKINGTPENIKIGLSSTPSLPQDEILAKVLFDKKISSLSPLQVAQLANAVRLLADGQTGSDLGMLNTVRSVLKVDEIAINGNNLEDTRIGAGKYISENIYVKGEQGAISDSTRVSVDVKLTDNFSIESTSGTTTQNNDIKLFWQKRY